LEVDVGRRKEEGRVLGQKGEGKRPAVEWSKRAGRMGSCGEKKRPAIAPNSVGRDGPEVLGRGEGRK